MTQMLELSDKDVKAAIITSIKSREIEKNLSGNFRTEMQHLKFKNSLNGQA